MASQHEESSESDGETEQARCFHRRLSTNKDIRYNSFAKEGYLNKQNGSFQRWHKRYFKLKSGVLYYSKDKKSTIFNQIDLIDSSIAERSLKNINHSFQVITPFRNLVLCAETRREMKDWLTAIRSAASKDYQEVNSEMSELSSLSDHHNWCVLPNIRPIFCNLCAESLHRVTRTGVTINSLACEVCKFRTHKKCASKSPSTCKWTTLASMGGNIIEDENRDLVMPHQWMMGNFPVSSKCLVCEKPCGSMLKLQDYWCLWCHCTVHAACKDLTVRCNLGPARISILPPTSITNFDEGGFWRASKSPNTSPLLVFLNSKSGDSQGVRMLRRFKQLLNPAQVFDLMNGGPKMGLRLFQNFESFRVLVCGGDGSVGWVLNEIDRLGLHKQCQVGVLPLGTGNDLSRVLGWGAAFDDDTQLPTLLEKLENAQIQMFDRWSIYSYEADQTRNRSLPIDPMCAYEDSAANHLSRILHSDSHNVVISSAMVLCGIVQELVSKVGSSVDEFEVHTNDKDSIACKCLTLNQKMEALLKTLAEESTISQSEAEKKNGSALDGKTSSSPMILEEPPSSPSSSSSLSPPSSSPLLQPLLPASSSSSSLTSNTLPTPYATTSENALISSSSPSSSSYVTMPSTAISTPCIVVSSSSSLSSSSPRVSATSAMCLPNSPVTGHRSPSPSLILLSPPSFSQPSPSPSPPPMISSELSPSSLSSKPIVSPIVCSIVTNPSHPSTRKADPSKSGAVQKTTRSQKGVIRSKEQLMMRANSLKKAIRRIVELTEKAVDEQNHQTTQFERDNQKKMPEIITSTTITTISSHPQHPPVASYATPKPTTTCLLSPLLQATPTYRAEDTVSVPSSDVVDTSFLTSFVGPSLKSFNIRVNNIPTLTVSANITSTMTTIATAAATTTAATTTSSCSNTTMMVTCSALSITSTTNPTTATTASSSSLSHSPRAVTPVTFNYQLCDLPPTLNLTPGHMGAVLSPSRNGSNHFVVSPARQHLAATASSVVLTSPVVSSTTASTTPQQQFPTSPSISYFFSFSRSSVSLSHASPVRSSTGLSSPVPSSDIPIVSIVDDSILDNEVSEVMHDTNGVERSHLTPPSHSPDLHHSHLHIPQPSYLSHRHQRSPHHHHDHKQTARLSPHHHHNYSSSDGEMSRCSTPGRLTPHSMGLPNLVDRWSPLFGMSAGRASSPSPSYFDYHGDTKAPPIGQSVSSPCSSHAGSGRHISSLSTMNQEKGIVTQNGVRHSLKGSDGLQFPLLNIPLLQSLPKQVIGKGRKSSPIHSSIISRVLLANADALCAPASPLADLENINLDDFTEKCVMNNYFGIGLDAKIALDFHNKREEHPHKCRSRTKNMMWYGVLGGKEILQRTHKNLDQRVRLECDGRLIPLPNLQGIVILNIPSYMGGTNFWGGSKEDEYFIAPSFDDKVLEVVAVFGSIQLGISRVINIQRHRIAQCRTVRITIIGDEGLPVQVDGEAWIQNPGVIWIQHKNRAQVLIRDRAFEEALKNWAEKQKMEHAPSRDPLLSESETATLTSIVDASRELIEKVGVITLTFPNLELPPPARVTKFVESFAARSDGKQVSKTNRGDIMEFANNLRAFCFDMKSSINKNVHSKNDDADVTAALNSLRNVLESIEVNNEKVHSIGAQFYEPCNLQRNRNKDKLRFFFKLSKSSRRHKGLAKHPYKPDVLSIRDWSHVEIAQWLNSLDLPEYTEAFIVHDIRGAELLTLGRTDLKELGVVKVGHLKRIMQEIKSIKEKLKTFEGSKNVSEDSTTTSLAPPLQFVAPLSRTPPTSPPPQQSGDSPLASLPFPSVAIAPLLSLPSPPPHSPPTCSQPASSSSPPHQRVLSFSFPIHAIQPPPTDQTLLALPTDPGIVTEF